MKQNLIISSIRPIVNVFFCNFYEDNMLPLFLDLLTMLALIPCFLATFCVFDTYVINFVFFRLQMIGVTRSSAIRMISKKTGSGESLTNPETST
jgi:hypothetical protein